MPRLMRRRLLCFYCGGRSAREYLPTMRLWECEICEATNHLDEQGDITDPPPLESVSQARFAQPIPRPSSPEFASPDESLFCKTCLQNQKFLTETLASYFPPSNDPEYPEYERKYPEYRKNLEDRYPQVCQKCEPRVRERIRITGYAAKTDHLRRMMERSRGGGSRSYHGWTWKRVALSIGAVGWYLSLAGQILWSLGGALTVEGNEIIDGLRDDTSPSVSSCLAQSWISGRPTFICSQRLAAVAGPALGLGCLSIWWNPRFKEQLDRGSGRILGLTEYYKVQLIFLVLRFASYVALTRTSLYDFDAGTRRGMHSFLVVFAFISAVISFRSIKLDLAPRVLFHDGLEPLTQQSQYIPLESQSDRTPGRRQSETPKTKSTIQPRPFPLNELAPDHARTQEPRYNPPTPPPDEDGIEEMDWTPSQQDFQPIIKPPATILTIQQPSPFYGRLPPNPLSQAHKLRNPPNQPTFRLATEAQKQSFFNRRRSHMDRDNMSEASTDCFDSPMKQSEVGSPRFAEPRFFPPSDHERNTGLESIFSNSFSIAEEPREVREAREEVEMQQSTDKTSRSVMSRNFQAVSFISLGVSVPAWTFAPSIPSQTGQIRFVCPAVAAIVAGRGLFESVRRDKAYWRWSDMFIYSLELCSSVFLSKASSKPAPKKGGEEDIDGLRMVGVVFLGIMFLQELWIWISNLERISPVSASASGASQTPPPPSSSPPPPLITDSAPTKKIFFLKQSPPSPSSKTKPKTKKQSSSTTNNKQDPPRQQQPPPPKKSQQQPPPAPSSERITRSKSRHETLSISATAGLGNLSLGGGGGGGGAGGGGGGWGSGGSGAAGADLDLFGNAAGAGNGIRFRKK